MEHAGIRKLEAADYEHPLDRAALKAIKKIPLLGIAVTKYIDFWMKVNIKVAIDGNHMLITPQTSPRVYKLKQKALSRLNMPQDQDYPLYQKLEWDYNAYTIGVKKSVIVLNSSIVEDLTDNELLFIIGHEMGHIKSGHVLYYQMAQMMLSQASGYMPALLTASMQLALLEWARKSELTADRAGLLACGDIDAACLTMAKLMGMPTDAEYFHPSMESIICQAKEFNAADFDQSSKIAYYIATAQLNHPWGAIRINEMQEWVQSDDYRNIITTIR
jgi:Zn-dependent protease with chaperone function